MILVDFLRGLAKKFLLASYIAMYRERRAFLKRLLDVSENGVLLDCGCREMKTTQEISEIIRPSIVIGIDHEFQALKQAAMGNTVRIQADLNAPLPLPDNSVDVASAIDVIEHLVEPYIFAKEVYRVLKPGGYFVVDTPNLASWHNVVALIIGMQPFSGPNVKTMRDSESGFVREIKESTYSWSQESDYYNDIERRLSKHIVVMAYRALVQLLREQGFKIEIAEGFGYYPFPPLIARLLQKLDKMHAHHIVVKARKPND